MFLCVTASRRVYLFYALASARPFEIAPVFRLSIPNYGGTIGSDYPFDRQRFSVWTGVMPSRDPLVFADILAVASIPTRHENGCRLYHGRPGIPGKEAINHLGTLFGCLFRIGSV